MNDTIRKNTRRNEEIKAMSSRLSDSLNIKDSIISVLDKNYFALEINKRLIERKNKSLAKENIIISRSLNENKSKRHYE